MKFIFALAVWAGLFVLANAFRLIPGPYSDVENRIAAFEVNTVALLASIVLVLAYTVYVHPRDTVTAAAAKMMIALTLLLQVWELANRVFCKLAANEMVQNQLPLGEAKGLCARSLGNGPVIALIVFGFGAAGYIAWKYWGRTGRGSSG